MKDANDKYKNASLKIREEMSAKLKSNLNKNTTDSGLKFLKLIEVIPNWETYLTPKQLEAAKIYIRCLNTYEVDHQLKLTYGTTQQRLFGNKTSKGALGRLIEVYKTLESNGYFEKQKKIKELLKQKKAKEKSKISEEVINKTKELIKLAFEIPDYEKYLTKSQAEKLNQFLHFRSYKKTAQYLGISEKSLQQSLLGKKENDGVLGRLKKVYDNMTVDSWDEI